MPIREYRCGLCDHRFERIMRFDERLRPAEARCACGGKYRRIAFSRNSFKLKGKGWAKDGYAKGGNSE